MRIVTAMSGGVDSSVAAFELKRKGYDVIGMTMKTWPKEECGKSGERLCCSLDAIQFARSVAEDMDVPYYVIDLSKEFTDIVKTYFVDEYSRGRTPNPCIYCNSKLKFGYMIKKAKELGAEKIATGHYARVMNEGGVYSLVEAKDEWQDQSYFLYDIAKEDLSFIEFPLGDMSKVEVREIAMEQGFMNADREASQDICFTTSDGDYRVYLEKLGVNGFEPGDILDTSGKVIGKHKGIAAYTVGQRRGIGLSAAEPIYVTRIDPENNTITVGEKESAMKTVMTVRNCNWLTAGRLDKKEKFLTRIRYNGDKVPATVEPKGDGEYLVTLDSPQFAPTPGQAAVFYDGNVVAGGGWIEEVIE